MAVVAAVLTLSSSAVGEPALQRWLLISIYLQWIGICSAATLCWARRWLRYARAGVVFFVCWGLLVVITTVISDLTYRLSGYMHWQFALGQDRITFILRHILIAALVAFLLLRYFRSEEHTSELQSLMRISYAVFCLKKKKKTIKLTQ